MPLRSIEEKNESNFKGSIIHIDTTGNLRTEFQDSRQYSEVKPFVIGTIDKSKLKIEYAEDRASMAQLRSRITDLLKELEKPLYAFNAPFVQAVLFHFAEEKIEIEGELNRKTFETRLFAINALNIPQYDDPFNDQDKMCSIIWLTVSGEHQKCIAHVKACLLKERDILIKRGFRKAEEVQLRK